MLFVCTAADPTAVLLLLPLEGFADYTWGCGGRDKERRWQIVFKGLARCWKWLSSLLVGRFFSGVFLFSSPFGVLPSLLVTISFNSFFLSFLLHFPLPVSVCDDAAAVFVN